MKIIALLLFVYSSNIFANEFSVIDRRDHSTKTYFKKVILEDLTSNTHFEGKYFKIVYKKSNEPIPFNAEKEIVQRAANIYYHLTQAKNFWQKMNPQVFSQLTIRLDITNNYSQLGHFSNDNLDPQYNNALSVPEGETPDWVPADKQDKWGKEIWFRPMKMISTKDMVYDLGPNPVTLALKQMQAPFINYTVNKFNQTLMNHAFYAALTKNSLGEDVGRFIGTLALTYFLIETSKKMDPLFVEKWFYLDTSMVPEVIYHEYAHLILSDELEMSHSTPVIEGYADYFAAIMSNKRKVYAKVPGYSNSNPKDPYHERHYTHLDELNATSDFVLAVLWDVRETLGAEVADQVIYESRKKLETRSATINQHMIRAILDTCSEICPSPRVDRLKLYETFRKRGF